MLAWALKKLLGTSHERQVKKLQPLVVEINKLEPSIAKLSDAELKAKTAEFKQKLENGATLDDILVEAFAVCREAGKRALRMRHYDVQMIGGMVLHKGMIAEMRRNHRCRWRVQRQGRAAHGSGLRAVRQDQGRSAIHARLRCCDA